MFAENISALKKSDPDLAQRLVGIPVSPGVKSFRDERGNFTVEISRPGKPTVRFSDVKDSRWVTKMPLRRPLKNSNLIILFGFGLGTHVLDIFRSTTEKTEVLVIEPDGDLFREALEGVDLTEILGSGRVDFSVGESPFDASYVRLENRYGVFTVRDFQIIRHPASVSLNEDYFRELDAHFGQLREMAVQNLTTLNVLSRVWQKNVFENVPAIFDRGGILSLFGKFRGVPAILVSAGPSLDKNVKWLEAAKGRAILICVDTALGTLVKNGIEPDFLVAVDAQVENYYHVEGIRVPHTCLIANPVSYPKIVSEFVGPILFTTYVDPVVQWVEKYTGDLGRNITGGSVATAAFDFAHRLGASPIVLVGQDLAFTSGRTHSAGTHYGSQSLKRISNTLGVQEQNDEIIRENELTDIEDGFGGSVRTSKKMNTWKNWFEIKIEKEKIDCVNSTEGGARIRGARFMSLQDVILEYCTRPVPVREILDRAGRNQPARDLAGFMRELNEMVQVCRKIKNLCGEGKRGVAQLQNEFDGSYPDSPRVGSKLKQLGELALRVTEDSRFVELNKWPVEFILDRVSQIREKSADLDPKRRLAGTIHAYDVLFDSLYNVGKTFEKIVSRALRNSKSPHSVTA